MSKAPSVAGVDGCRGGWLCVSENREILTPFVGNSFSELLDRLPAETIIAIDIPIGLTEAGPRACDIAARRLLGPPRASSVFAAPVRAVLSASTYEEACILHQRADGRKLSKQAFGILRKIAEVDHVLRHNPALQDPIREIHPEVSFAIWNSGSALRYRKSCVEGRAEREHLIEGEWPADGRLHSCLRDQTFAVDDLNDAIAALWTARRIAANQARVLPSAPSVDAFGLRMEIVV